MTAPDRQQLLRDAVEDLLAPLARLCVAQGLPFAQAEELFKRAYVRAARDARRQAGAAASRDVSQVSVATGINRREVTRIGAELQPRAVQRPAPATQVFLRWISDRKLRGRDGKPRALARSGKRPSFDSLARSVTSHVHPRSLLDELVRLGLAELDADAQTVRLLVDRFVPQQDEQRLYTFLAANVGDHLSAAVSNVIHRDRRHVEQAVFVDDLSAESAQQIRGLAQAQWRSLVTALAPQIERLIEQDQAQGRTPTHRARVGLFSYQEPLQETSDDTATDNTPNRSTEQH